MGAEPMQVLRYETGQFYKTHHDQNSPRASAWGPRMFTVFMYVGDGYEGGLTDFPKLNVTVPAKKGAVCIWTSVLDTDPYQRDDRTDHQSLPVESGVKYGGSQPNPHPHPSPNPTPNHTPNPNPNRKLLLLRPVTVSPRARPLTRTPMTRRAAAPASPS